mmetsp:Transcript_9030/g.10365  ORF Transcript_9030/g.10365 Transcript_9030/m.10365 type:complete len:197 (-) Transcript_9030:142-732(-)
MIARDKMQVYSETRSALTPNWRRAKCSNCGIIYCGRSQEFCSEECQVSHEWKLSPIKYSSRGYEDQYGGVAYRERLYQNNEMNTGYQAETGVMFEDIDDELEFDFEDDWKEESTAALPPSPTALGKENLLVPSIPIGCKSYLNLRKEVEIKEEELEKERKPFAPRKKMPVLNEDYYGNSFDEADFDDMDDKGPIFF